LAFGVQEVRGGHVREGEGHPDGSAAARRVALRVGLILVLALAVVGCDRRSAVTQPIAFNHKAHIDNGLECTFCHASVESAEHADVPPSEICTACHMERPDRRQVVVTDEGQTGAPQDEGEGETVAAALAAFDARGEPVPWRRIYNLPSHVYVSHRRHVTVARIACAECHGDVPSLTRPASYPLVDHTMDWCTGCHVARGASTDCIHCHR
jgi:hypothetical protein